MQTAPVAIPPVVYGVTDAARVLGISAGYLHRLIEVGRARPSVPMGLAGRKVFSPDDLRRVAAELGRDLDHDRPREVA